MYISTYCIVYTLIVSSLFTKLISIFLYIHAAFVRFFIKETVCLLAYSRSLETELDIEYYRDLEMWVRRYSESLVLVPFESQCAVFYSPSIVSMAVSVAVYECQRT